MGGSSHCNENESCVSGSSKVKQTSSNDVACPTETAKTILSPFSRGKASSASISRTQPSQESVDKAYRKLRLPVGCDPETAETAATDMMANAENAWITCMTDIGYKVVPRTKIFSKDHGGFRTRDIARQFYGSGIIYNPWDGPDARELPLLPHEQRSENVVLEAYRFLEIEEGSDKHEIFDAAVDRMRDAEIAYVVVLTSMGYNVVPSKDHPLARKRYHGYRGLG